MTDEKFIFTTGAKKTLGFVAVAGIIALVLGIITVSTGDHHPAAHGPAMAEAPHEAFHWTKRLFANLWINNVYFTGIAVIGLFFVALQYVSQAGWSASIKRIPLAYASWLPFAGVLMIGVFLIGNHDIFHWTHEYLYDKNDPRFDRIINGKKAYLNFGFFLGRMVLYFVLWYMMYRLIKRESLKEDVNGGTEYWHRLVKFSTFFILIFAVTSSTSAWDWVLSIDTHWFSTMFGWYVFASWFVSGLAAITLGVVLLKENGYLKIVNSNHLHDLGKFVFAFSIFWTYIWFSQFLLIYYANIPEESIYYVERLSSHHYSPIFFINLIMNFAFPFLMLMTRDAKRYTIFLKIVCCIVLAGHWLDFYLMVTPGTLSEHGGFGFMEIGSAMIYAAAFGFVVLTSLAKAPLIAKNHPMLQESIHHHI
jgi:hypothetical protein